jgi:hypothetical protein
MDDLVIICALCGESFTVPDNAVTVDVMATIIHPTGDRFWLPLCPLCSDFLGSRGTGGG